jgi:hypothetical protein
MRILLTISLLVLSTINWSFGLVTSDKSVEAADAPGVGDNCNSGGETCLSK